MIDKRNFRRDYKRIKVEGFNQQTLLSKCAKEGIALRDIEFLDEVEMSMYINTYDLKKFYGFSKNKYKVTILKENGYLPGLKSLFNKKSMIVGILIFFSILYYQSLFISEIRIYGYEKNTETQIRTSLAEAGLYEGCRKDIDLKEIKLKMYGSLKNISWIGISYVGNMAQVTISESEIYEKKIGLEEPCNIVAKKGGYVEKITAKEGFSTVSKGAYLKPGDVGITGICPVKDTAYVATPGGVMERYVHAKGNILAKVPYRFPFYIDKYEIKRVPTGKKLYGFNLQLGDFQFNSVEAFCNWDSWVYKEEKIVDLVRPIPLKISFAKGTEIKLEAKEKDEKTREKEANRILRQIIKENVPEKGQIINKSLKFTPKVNIIEVESLLEIVEEIGVEAKL